MSSSAHQQQPYDDMEELEEAGSVCSDAAIAIPKHSSRPPPPYIPVPHSKPEDELETATVCSDLAVAIPTHSSRPPRPAIPEEQKPWGKSSHAAAQALAEYQSTHGEDDVESGRKKKPRPVKHNNSHTSATQSDAEIAALIAEEEAAARREEEKEALCRKDEELAVMMAAQFEKEAAAAEASAPPRPQIPRRSAPRHVPRTKSFDRKALKDSVKRIVARTLSGGSTKRSQQLSDMEEARPLTHKRPDYAKDEEGSSREVKKVPPHLGQSVRHYRSSINNMSSSNNKSLRSTEVETDDDDDYEETQRTMPDLSASGYGEDDPTPVESNTKEPSEPTRKQPRKHKTLAEIRKERYERQASQRSLMVDNSSKTTASAIVQEVQEMGCCGIRKKTWSCMILILVICIGIAVLTPMLLNLQKQRAALAGPDQKDDEQVPSGDNSGDPWGSGSDSNVILANPSDLHNGDYEWGPAVAVTNVDASASAVPTNAQQEQLELDPPINAWNLLENKRVPNLFFANTESMTNGWFHEDQLTRAAELFVQGTVHENIRKPLLPLEVIEEEGGNSLAGEYIIPFMDTPLAMYDGEVPYPTSRNSNGKPIDKYPQGDVTKWEQELQSAGIHESDAVQLDEARGVLYVGHEQHIDVIDVVTGTMRTTIKLPPTPRDGDPARMADGLLLRHSWMLPAESDKQEQGGWTPAPPTPFIEQLLLTSSGDYLVVVVSNYTSVHKARIKPLLLESSATHLLTYQVLHSNNVTTYEMVGDPRVVHGRVVYAAQATKNQHIHIVTSSRIDTERLLQSPFERLYYPDRDDEVYAKEVLVTARDKYVPLLKNRLLEEINEMDEVTILPVTHWVAEAADNTMELDEQEQYLQHMVTTQNHLLQELVVVTSLSIVQTNSQLATYSPQTTTFTATSTAVMSTVFFAPPSTSVIGSTDTLLTLSVPGFQWRTGDSTQGVEVKKEMVLEEASHLLQFELGTISVPGASHKAATRFQSMATVPGRHLDKSPRHSTERRHGELRVATVATRQWSLGVAQHPKYGYERTVVEEREVRRSYMNLLSSLNLETMADSPLELFVGEGTLLSAVSFLDDVAYAFPLEPLSSYKDKTSIQVVQFSSLDENTTPSVQLLGAATFGASGFSPSVHPLRREVTDKDTRKLFVSIGEGTSETGPTTELMMTLWDATEPTNLKPLAQQSVVAGGDSLTTWTPQTFRVTSQGEVILPITVESAGEAFNGFFVYDVTEAGIQESTRILHSTVVMNRSECYGEEGCPLEPKTFWNDNTQMLLTIKESSARATHLSVQDAVATERWLVLLG